MTHTYHPTHRRLFMNVSPIVLQGCIQWLVHTILHIADSVWMYHRLCYRAVFNDSYIPSYTLPTLYECNTDCVTGPYSMTHTYHPTHHQLFMNVSPIVLQGCIQWLVHTILHTANSLWMYHRLCYRAVFNDSYIPSYTPPTLYECITDCVTGLYSMTRTYHPTHCQLFMNVSPIVLQGCIQWLIHTILHTSDSLWMYHRLCYRAVFNDSYIPSYTPPTLYPNYQPVKTGALSSAERPHSYIAAFLTASIVFSFPPGTIWETFPFVNFPCKFWSNVIFSWSVYYVVSYVTAFKAKMYEISSDTHQLQFIKLHHFKQERF